MKITADNLRRKSACREAVAWYETAGLDDLDWSEVRAVDGDATAESWAGWLAVNIPCGIERVGAWRYEYGDRGNLISETYRGGEVRRYAYDERGNLISMTYPNGEVYRYEHDDRGNRVSMTYPDSEVYRYEYDERAIPSVTARLTMRDGSVREICGFVRPHCGQEGGQGE